MDTPAKGTDIKCFRCQGSGVCPPCKGIGRSGFLLIPPALDSPLCRLCKGSGKCDGCGGKGTIDYEPRIYIEHSRLFPTSITCAAVTGGFWRYIEIPHWVRRRSDKAQRRWVQWRVRNHFIEKHGKLRLFGDITGYRYDVTGDTSIRLDIHGRYVRTVHWVHVPQSDSLDRGATTTGDSK